MGVLCKPSRRDCVGGASCPQHRPPDRGAVRWLGTLQKKQADLYIMLVFMIFKECLILASQACVAFINLTLSIQMQFDTFCISWNCSLDAELQSWLFSVFCVTEISLNVFLFLIKDSGDDILSKLMNLEGWFVWTSLRTLNVPQQIKTIWIIN